MQKTSDFRMAAGTMSSGVSRSGRGEMMKRAAMYARVSTDDKGQDPETK